MWKKGPLSLKSRELVPATFEYLAHYRNLLREFCTFHVAGLAPFFRKETGVFALHAEDEVKQFRHITSSATCFSSLELCFEKDSTFDGRNFKELMTEFACQAIQQDVNEKWKSDGKAEVYCTCRGLPFVLSQLENWHPNIPIHLKRIKFQLDEQPIRCAIGEAAPPVDNKGEDLAGTDREKVIDGWYEPNAYHTYWTLELLAALENRFKGEAKACDEYHYLNAKVPIFHLWARQQLGLQIALHTAKSSKLDSDQLAWALAILIREPANYQSDLALQDIIREALKCLFATQEPVGTWRHYAPLFHYPNAGNAYCFVFETFTVLLEQSLKPQAEFLRSALKEHVAGLISLWKYADSIKATIPTVLKRVPGISYGWTSGHRIRPEIESWATASVFAYAQMLRRLVGIWTRETALDGLNHKRSAMSRQEALDTLNDRSRTWTQPDLPDILTSMFINPLSDLAPESTLDPDRYLIEKRSARSVILFGPPGTGKTTLISGIADAIGWRYIELHPSHFVSEGLPNVQHTADGIFGKLMEIDHAVILFDEIDELVRERNIEPDQFGRFLTTSMLPRLAELWKARKVIYFVATNHIEAFDVAITRSSRFDAVIFLSPPDFEVKKKKILQILREDYSIRTDFSPDLNQALVEKSFPQEECYSELSKTENAGGAEPPKRIPEENLLAKFAIVRWDELHEIALRLASILPEGQTITKDVLGQSLRLMRDGRVRGLEECRRFVRDPELYQRFDASINGQWRVIETEGVNLSELAASSKHLEKRGEVFFARAPIGPCENVHFPGYIPKLKVPEGEPVVLGAISLAKEKAEGPE
ncbi:ATPase, AAA family [Acidobacterium capsulatum ATCC 51196]|uniref:ATPase, AAA family n=1 Tax=Acidobacterium capsulatum (strain ATCC 51196 / DSM 11244 / BCRC 80197 / JCM 7670 / NBRC 15755 / NCIMB 13165 / 161) TaxID=240015 RepID=C1F1P6_ACIC5|nr:ATPase, AAA family [Acidobacterium capsulatum ATCC 51196]